MLVRQNPRRRPPSRGPVRGRSQTKKAAVCPVNPKDKCLECHMPKVPMPTCTADLTDHYIRVHDRKKK